MTPSLLPPRRKGVMPVWKTGPRLLGLVLFAALAGALATEQPEPEAPPAPGPEAAVVQVTGLAPMPPGTPVEEARDAALAAARREALRRCCVLVEQTTTVEGHRLGEQRTRERELGYVRSVDIAEEGPVQAEGGPAYRVVAHVGVEPLGAFTVADALSLVRPDPWKPVARLAPAGGQWTEVAKAGREKLTRALRRCGVAVAEEADRPAVDVQLEVRRIHGAGGGALEVSWQVEAPAPARAEEPADPVQFRGRWRRAGEGAPGLDWWDGLGVAVAQDVMRLWALPRWATVRFGGVEGERAVELVRAFGVAAGQVRTDERAGEVVIEVPVTGNPLAAVEAILERAQMREVVELVGADLSRITYRLRGTEAVSEDNGDQDDPEQGGDQPPEGGPEPPEPTL